MAGGGGHDLITLTPVLECNGVAVAAVGLVNMLNAGGAVRGLELQEAQGGWQGSPRGRAATARRMHVCACRPVGAALPALSSLVYAACAGAPWNRACCQLARGIQPPRSCS